jgi:hypothetical protein
LLRDVERLDFVQELYRLLSAFNLNIEIVAPECLIPDVSFTQKFGFILALPFAVCGLFLVITGTRILFSRYVLRQRRWKSLLRSSASSISVVLVLMFLLYLYVTKTILSIWECLPTDPDDGKLYLQVVFEECGKPGGVQEQLSGWAAMGVVFIVVGYPLTIFFALMKNRETVMEDQLLRAIAVEPPKGTEANFLRSVMGRTYYQFKPDYAPFWILIILIRKFCIALSSLMFSKNSAFQMSMCLLVLFVAFTLQTRYLPYMPKTEFAMVTKDALARAETVPLYNRLKARVAGVEGQTKKRTFRNALDGVNMVRARFVFQWLLNYNTIEAVLLFDAAMVCLLGVLYEAVRPTDVYYASSRSSITAFLMVLIIFGIIYFASVFSVDIGSQYTEKRVEAALQVARKKKATTAIELMGTRDKSMRRSSTFDTFRTDPTKRAEAVTSTNPMFLKADGTANLEGSLTSAIADQLDPPSAGMWNVVRENYTAMAKQIGELTEVLNQERTEAQRLKDMMEESGLLGAPAESRKQLRPAASGRRVFDPIRTEGEVVQNKGIVSTLNEFNRISGAVATIRKDGDPSPTKAANNSPRTRWDDDASSGISSRRALIAARKAESNRSFLPASPRKL